MVKKPSSIYFLILILAAGLGLRAQRATAQDADAAMQRLWQISDGLNVPESVLVDDSGSFAYVSNIAGMPTEKDGKGYISKISIDGNMIEAEWVKGLDAPKGMVKYLGKLYVTDIDRLVEIEPATGIITRRIPVEGAQFLNDLAVDQQGILYITDTKAGRVYIYYHGEVFKWLDDPLFANANGLFCQGGYLYVGTSKCIMRINTKTGESGAYITTPTSADGIYVTDEQQFVYSDWTGHIYLASPGRPTKTLLNTLELHENAADFAYFAPKNLLLVPTFKHHSVVAYSYQIPARHPE